MPKIGATTRIDYPRRNRCGSMAPTSPSSASLHEHRRLQKEDAITVQILNPGSRRRRSKCAGERGQGNANCWTRFAKNYEVERKRAKTPRVDPHCLLTNLCLRSFLSYCLRLRPGSLLGMRGQAGRWRLRSPSHSCGGRLSPGWVRPRSS